MRELSREQILAYRRRASGLDARAPMSTESLRLAAWGGLQDSMPRAALLSIHARVAGTPPEALDDAALTQIWGPRFSVYVIATADVPVFTLGRLPDDARGRRRAIDTADKLDAFLAGRRMKDREVHAALHWGNSIRYATATGRVLIRWEGALAPLVWTIPTPEMSETDAKLELARRYLHIFGPGNAESFARWAGVSGRSGVERFRALEPELTQVVTPLGNEFLLKVDEPLMNSEPQPVAGVRLLPSGDSYFLLWGREREVLVPDARRRSELWTSRVWPGALLVDGEIAGVWRRAHDKLSVDLWRPLTAAERDAVEAEARALPLPGLTRPMSVSFAQAA